MERCFGSFLMKLFGIEYEFWLMSALFFMIIYFLLLFNEKANVYTTQSKNEMNI